MIEAGHRQTADVVVIKGAKDKRTNQYINTF